MMAWIQKAAFKIMESSVRILSNALTTGLGIHIDYCRALTIDLELWHPEKIVWRGSEGEGTLTAMTIAFSVCGFVVQFLGLRALHWLAMAAQL
jgi:hypothetical protein